jgi:hypothetical protein
LGGGGGGGGRQRCLFSGGQGGAGHRIRSSTVRAARMLCMRCLCGSDAAWPGSAREADPVPTLGEQYSGTAAFFTWDEVIEEDRGQLVPKVDGIAYCNVCPGVGGGGWGGGKKKSLHS